MEHLWAIFALVVLCAAWVLFQRWLERVDPDSRKLEIGCGGCSDTYAKKEAGQCESSGKAAG